MEKTMLDGNCENVRFVNLTKQPIGTFDGAWTLEPTDMYAGWGSDYVHDFTRTERNIRLAEGVRLDVGVEQIEMCEFPEKEDNVIFLVSKGIYDTFNLSSRDDVYFYIRYMTSNRDKEARRSHVIFIDGFGQIKLSIRNPDEHKRHLRHVKFVNLTENDLVLPSGLVLPHPEENSQIYKSNDSVGVTVKHGVVLRSVNGEHFTELPRPRSRVVYIVNRSVALANPTRIDLGYPRNTMATGENRIKVSTIVMNNNLEFIRG